MTSQGRTVRTMSIGETVAAVEARVADLPHQDLVSHFVAIFSRFEYSLKANDFCKPNRKQAEPDWDSFAKKLDRLRECRDERTLRAIAYFDGKPPLKQVITAGVLDWKDTRPHKQDNKTLLMLVRRVRNNLFHGGKPHIDPDRDAKLFQSAEAIMVAALSLHTGMRNAFLRRKLNATT